MTERRRQQLLTRGEALGYTGNNLGQLYAHANSIARGLSRQTYTGNQRRSARSIANALSGSA